MPRQIGYIVGSLRKESYNRKLAGALIKLAPPDFNFKELKIGDLPLYDQDDDKAQAPEVQRLKSELRAVDAVVFVTAEYNRSIPGVLKNAIDVGSRPYGQSAWSKKPCAVVSVSPGALAAFGANHHLRQCLVFLEMPALQMETYIGNVSKLFDEKGNLTNADTRAFLQKTIDAFAAWIDATAAKA
jgi:chromate reductase, NAD(P)H dehydrogenase (quinone)